MSKTKKHYNQKFTVSVQGDTATVYRINNDINGNPRYVIHFLALNVKLQDYGKIPGLTKYRAKWFGGGYVFQSYHVQDDLQFLVDHVQAYYDKQAQKVV